MVRSIPSEDPARVQRAFAGRPDDLHRGAGRTVEVEQANAVFVLDQVMPADSVPSMMIPCARCGRRSTSNPSPRGDRASTCGLKRFGGDRLVRTTNEGTDLRT